MNFLLLAACDAPEDPAYRYGVVLADLELVLVSDDVGVFPDSSVLFDENNPFRGGLVGDSKWDVLEDGPVAAFYAWATVLAGIPTGEHQYYTALQLHQIYDQQLSHPDDVSLVRDLAIRGYQSTLDNFPGALTYDGTGRVGYPLGPLAVQGIEALGGLVQNGWVVVADADGDLTVVQNQ